ncbi:MAG TPA: hypothetical protein DDZ66_10310 [Firmicutes bacterium]|jgi:hypothetical protein|nr:hypothetical protein [Bacillota bacterium]
MLVSEVRDVLKKYQEEDLRLLLVEMYKAMPKKLKEDKEIDMLLQDVHGYMSARKAPKAQERQIDLESLKFRIDQFVEYAYNQYYYAPLDPLEQSKLHCLIWPSPGSWQVV